MITAELVRNIGRKNTLELMLTGKRLSAIEAKEMCLVNRVVPHESLQTETMNFANEIISANFANSET